MLLISSNQTDAQTDQGGLMMMERQSVYQKHQQESLLFKIANQLPLMDSMLRIISL